MTAEIPPLNGGKRSVVAGHYEVDLNAPLGSGGMAIVYEGRDLRTRRTVALKTLRPDFRHDPETRARFRREARSMAFVKHPNVARLYDLFEDTDGPWAILEYVPGHSLKDEIARNGPLDLETTAHLLDQIASALTHLHQKRLVHLDVKPHNLLLTPDKTVKLIDFGLAQRVGQPQETIGGQAFGTAAYLAPEQACGDPVSAATDVYALGCVVYELLTGTPPFTLGEGQTGRDGEENKDEIIRAHLEQTPARLTQRRPDLHLPAWVDDVVLWALVKQPDDRYQDAEIFARLFHNHVHDETVEVVESATPQTSTVIRARPFVPTPPTTHDYAFPAPAAPARPIFGNQVVGALYRAGGRRLRRARINTRRLWQASAVVAIGNLLLALALLVDHGTLPGVIAADATLAAGHEAQVVAESFRIRAAPGLDAETLTLVEAGDRLTITGDATANDGRTWWPVRLDDNDRLQGFIAQEGIAPVENDEFALVSDLIDMIRNLPQ